jgi:uncharacterized membrane protein YkoI
MKMKPKFVLATIAAMTLAAVGSAYEAKSVRDVTWEITPPEVGLAAAVATAEHHVHGKVLSAEYNLRVGQWIVDVEELGDGKVMDVEVDAASGTIIAAGEDGAEQDDDRDQAG